MTKNTIFARIYTCQQRRGVFSMFYNEEQAIKACSDEPSLIFILIKEGHKDLVDKILSKKLVDINILDSDGNDVITRMLRKSWYDLVYKYMKRKEWNVNNQNIEGNTFSHYLVTVKYLDVMEIIKELIKNKSFMPNIINKQGESILDRSLHNNYIYTTIKILEDERFNTIDIMSFKTLYEKYIKNNQYGTYSKINNLEIIMDSLADKKLIPRMTKLIQVINKNFDEIKGEAINNQVTKLDYLINGLIKGAI